MAEINGTNLASGVVPFSTEDTYATHFAKYGQGGWQSVDNIQARDAIVTSRREAGMAVYVVSEKKVYTLESDLTTWTELTTGGGDIDLTPYATKEEVNAIVENLDVLPDQADNAGKFLMTDGLTASWEKALTNNATRENYIAIGNNALITEDEYGSGVSIGANTNAQNNSVAIGGYAEAIVAGGLAIGNNAKVNNFDATTVYDENGIAIGTNTMSTNAQAIAIGGDAQSNGAQAIAIGTDAKAYQEGAVSLGDNAQAYGVNTIVIGSNAITDNDASNSIVIGNSATNAGSGSVVIGNNAKSSSPNGSNVVVGDRAKATGYVTGSTAVGPSTTANSYQSTAIGYNSISGTDYSLAIGFQAQTNANNFGEPIDGRGEGNIAIGSLAESTSNDSIAIGDYSKANGKYSVALGADAQSNGTQAIAVGSNSSSIGSNAIAIGTNTQSLSPDGIAIGRDAKGVSESIAIGYYTSGGMNSVTIGSRARCGSSTGVSIGYASQTNSDGLESIAIGSYSGTNKSHAIALGYYAKASYENSIAIGKKAEAKLSSCIAIGNEAKSIVTDGIAIGNSAQNTDAFGIAIGSASQAGRVGIAIGINAKSYADRAIQIGEGDNTEDGSLQINNYTLLRENGVVPYSRLSDINDPMHGQVLTYDEDEDALYWADGGSDGISEVNWGDINGNLSDQEDLNDKFDDIRSNFQDINQAIQGLEMDYSTTTRRLEGEIQDVEDKLQSQVDNLSAIGQFLAIWDCDTHTARYLTEGYEYQTGNYFIIGSVTTDGVNYMPNGSSYPGYVETTEDVKVSDMWFYDGVNWIYLANHERAIAIDAELDALSTNPVENKAVAKAIGDLDSLVDIKLDDINVAIEELQNRPTGVGVPQLASVDVLQVKTPDEAQDRYYSYTEWMGQYSDIVVTLNLSKQEILEKMYDLYITISRFKTNKNLNYDDDGEAKKYRNISKFSVMNDFRQKTNIRAYCWRMIYDDSLPETNPARYCYFYTQDLYTSTQACLENAHDIGLWSNYMGPVSYATCFNAIGWTNGYSANDYLHDYGDTTIGIERYEEGDISEFANLGNAGADYTTKRECREYTRDGQKYFFWCQDWDDRNAEIYNKTDDNDNPLPNAIPVHMDELNYVWNMFDLPSSFEFVKKRPDLNYRAVNDPYAFFEALEELTFKGKYVDDDGTPTYWNCYWFDYPVMPIMLKDCEARIQFKATKDDYTASVRAGEWHTLEYLYNNNLLHSLSDDLPIELKLPYNTYYLWMRFCSLQKRCAYGDYSNWLDEEGRNIDTPMYPEQKHNLYEGVTSYNILNKRAFARPRQSYRNNGFSKISETIQFNLCEPMDVASGSKSKATPIQKKLFITSTAKSGLRN